MSHTPGPWKVVPAADDDSWGVTRTGVEGCSIAQMVWYFDSPLIAAAPELLVACKAALNDRMFKDGPGVAQILIDAIAKAEGR